LARATCWNRDMGLLLSGTGCRRLETRTLQVDLPALAACVVVA